MEHVAGDLIWKFLNGDALSDDLLDGIALHMSECDFCAERLANMAELGSNMPEMLPLVAPPAGLTDRIMSGIEQLDRQAVTTSAHAAPEETHSAPPALPFAARKQRSPRFELFTRVATAAVVTGLMIFGSAGQSYAEQVPVVGKTIAAVSNTGNLFTDGTARIYSELHYLFSSISFDFSK